MKKMKKAAQRKMSEFGKKMYFAKCRLNAGMVAVLTCLLIAGSAHAAVDTSALDAVVADCGTWIAYGITSFLTLLGAGLTIVAASWVYKKVKGAIKSN